MPPLRPHLLPPTMQPPPLQPPPPAPPPQPRTCSASFAAVFVHTEMRSCLGRTLTTMPQISSPSSNCSPMLPSTPCSHMVSSTCLLALGTMAVHLPPCSQRGSSHLGSMPSRNRCRSEPAERREGGMMLLYRLQQRKEGRRGQGKGDSRELQQAEAGRAAAAAACAAANGRRAGAREQPLTTRSPLLCQTCTRLAASGPRSPASACRWGCQTTASTWSPAGASG